LSIPENPTPEELEQMRQIVQAEDQRLAEAAAAARVTKLAALRAVLDDESYDTVLIGLKAVYDGGALADEPNILPHLEALVTIMPVLNQVTI